MKKIVFVFIYFIFFFLFPAHSQNTFTAIVRDSLTHETLIGVSAVVDGTLNGTNSDASGKVMLTNIPDGTSTISFSMIGFQKKTISFQFH